MNKVSLERHGKRRMLAKVPWMGGRGRDMAKMVSGCSPLWDKTGPRDRFVGWTYPLNLETCRDLRKVFGELLKMGPELRAWAVAEVERERAQASLRTSYEAELPGAEDRAPLLAMAFRARPYQPVAVQFALEGQRVVIADEPGLGKTLETLGAVTMAGCRRTLIFCKKTAMSAVWHREISRWLPESMVFVADNPAKARRQAVLAEYLTWQETDEIGEGLNDGYLPPAYFVICNTEMVRVKKDEVDGVRYETPDYPELFDPHFKWDAIVVDESHRGLIGFSHLSKNITQTRLGAIRLPLANNGLKLALSGTPFRGKEINIWGTLNWLWPDTFTSYWNFAKRYFETAEGEYSNIVIDGGGHVREDAQEDFDRMLARYLIRRTKAEVASDLPPKVYAGTPLVPEDESSPHGVWLELTPPQARAYKQLKQDARIQLQGGILIANGVLAEMTRMKQFADSHGEIDGREFTPTLPSSKFDWIVEFLEEQVQNEGKVIIASQFTKIVNLFGRELARLGFYNFVITGETPQRNRDAIVRKFADPADPIRIVLINTMAGGESITLDEADVVIIVDETFIPDDQLQVEDRAHRVSREAGRVPVTVYYLRSLGTIDEDIAVECGVREGACRERLDGSRGIEILKARAGVA